MKKRFLAILAIATALPLAGCGDKFENTIIPKPVEVTPSKGWIKSDAEPTVTVEEGFAYGDEGYILDIKPEGISITAGTEAGVFYAMQSLAQLRAEGRRIHAQRIVDYPRFEYRGVMLDVSRHFRDKEFIKKQLLMFASLKFNRFHIHLVDGAGWRFPTDSHPELNRIASWRPQEYYYDWVVEHKYCTEDTPGAYGGWYTKDDLREIVAFADSLHITVVPEIEMFGHSTEVTGVLPQLACGKAEARQDENGQWFPGQAVYCIGKEETFEFLEEILDEVMEIFPSEYIHIGGDEANKKYWKSCPDCQKRIRENHLDGVDGLQSYGIGRIEKFVNSRGRQIIGWDEILEGGLAPNAAVMSWRGEEGGRAAAAAGHKVVMTPGPYCYLDKCQGNPETEPAGFGGFLSISKVYSYDPAPETMEGREFVMGVQGNLWTELVKTPEHAEHMYYPRVFALAEVAWTPQEERDYADFAPRAIKMCKRASEMGYNVYDMSLGEEFREGSDKPESHLAQWCAVQYGTPCHERYRAAGDSTLVDGLAGGWSYGDQWQGWLNEDCVVTLDLGEVKSFSTISASFGRWSTAEIYLPEYVRYEISSDGESFEELSTIQTEEADKDRNDRKPAYRDYRWSGKAEARYIRMTGKISEDGAGWLFTDEIFVK